MQQRPITDTEKHSGRHPDSWDSAPDRLILKQTEIHVWQALLEQPETTIQSLQDILSKDEQARADRFHFSHHREHFIVARGLLRKLLGRYINSDPVNMVFSYNAYGKPSLSFPHHQTELSFNLSHSHGLALYAITKNRRIGIDVEMIRTDFATDEIAERFFSAYEYSTIKALPSDLQAEGFFNCWTRKEAYIKAVGKGLSLPLDKFDVSIIPGEPAVLLRVNDDIETQDCWSLQDLSPATGFRAALAIDGHGLEMKLFEAAGLLNS